MNKRQRRKLFKPDAFLLDTPSEKEFHKQLFARMSQLIAERNGIAIALKRIGIRGGNNGPN